MSLRSDGAGYGGDQLARLRGDEAGLERSVAEARAAASDELETARREAERLASEGRVAAEAERDAQRAATAAELASEAEEARQADLQEAQDLQRRAEAWRERALARVLAVVRGEAT